MPYKIPPFRLPPQPRAPYGPNLALPKAIQRFMNLRVPPGLPSVPARPGPLHTKSLMPPFARLDTSQISDYQHNSQLYRFLLKGRQSPMTLMQQRAFSDLYNAWLKANPYRYPPSPTGVPINNNWWHRLPPPPMPPYHQSGWPAKPS